MEAPKKSEEAKTSARLGSLLLLSELITEAQMNQAMEMASALNLPLGKVLVMLGFINGNVLVASVEMQSLQRDRLIEIDTLKAALKLVAEQGMSATAALAKCGWSPDDTSIFSKLGELLRESRIISEFQLKNALESASKSQIPLGRVLVVNKIVSESVVWAALNAQVLLRDNRITRAQAIAALRAAHRRHTASSPTSDATRIEPPTRKIKLGDMLVLSGLLSEEKLREALESSLLNECPVGEVLVQKGLLSKRVMDAALKIQDMVTNDVVAPQAAGMILKSVAENKRTIPQAVAEIGVDKLDRRQTVRLGELLKLSGILTEDDIKHAISLSVLNTSLLGKILVSTGQIGESTLQNGLRCQYLLQQSAITEEQAVLALNFCQRMHCSFDEALKELGYSTSR